MGAGLGATLGRGAMGGTPVRLVVVVAVLEVDDAGVEPPQLEAGEGAEEAGVETALGESRLAKVAAVVDDDDACCRADRSISDWRCCCSMDMITEVI